MILDDVSLSSEAFQAILRQANQVSDVTLVGLTFSDAVDSLSHLFDIGTLDNVAVDQALYATYEAELNAFAAEAGNTLAVIGYGDANKDGEFNSSDLIEVFRAGKYEDDIDNNSYWTEGDWNSDGDFDTSDLVVAFESGGYEQGPRIAANAVPEPTSLVMLFTALIAIAIRRRCVVS